MVLRKVMFPSPTVKIEEQPKILSMYYGGNGDVYWDIQYKGLEDNLFDGEIEVGQEIPELFEQFNILYNGIVDRFGTENFIGGRLFNPDTNTITWFSDNDISFKEANILYITKGEKSFKIRIVAQLAEDGKVKDEGQNGNLIAVRFRTEGSRYDDCFRFFTFMYQSLMAILNEESSKGKMLLKQKPEV